MNAIPQTGKASTRNELMALLEMEPELLAEAHLLRMELHYSESLRKELADSQTAELLAAADSHGMKEQMQRHLDIQHKLMDLEQLIGQCVCDKLLTLSE